MPFGLSGSTLRRIGLWINMRICMPPFYRKRGLDMKKEFVRAVPVLERLEQRGHLAYFVGGSVRDSIMGKKIHDVDIATSATPQEVKELFDRTIDVGIQHGTVLVFHEGEPYEVTTFRTESQYKD